MAFLTKTYIMKLTSKKLLNYIRYFILSSLLYSFFYTFFYLSYPLNAYQNDIEWQLAILFDLLCIFIIYFPTKLKIVILCIFCINIWDTSIFYYQHYLFHTTSALTKILEFLSYFTYLLSTFMILYYFWLLWKGYCKVFCVKSLSSDLLEEW